MIAAGIDNFLITHAPAWYCTPKAQAVTLGLVFFWVFAAYTTIQFYSASTYGSDLAADSVSAIYFTFTVTCLISPAIINKWGCRPSMFLGVLGYATLILTSLIYFLYGGDEVVWARRTVVMGGAVLGVGASTLWTAQGRLILQYASRAEELELEASKQMSNGGNSKPKTQTGKLMGLFWAIFQCSALVGGSISFLYYNKKPEGSTSLYVLFLTFIIIGALFTQLLLPPCILTNAPNAKMALSRQKNTEMITEQTPLNIALATEENVSGELQVTDDDINMSEDLSHLSWSNEGKGTLKLVFTRKMLCLSLLFFYTVSVGLKTVCFFVFMRDPYGHVSCYKGFNQPYQQATFGNRFFTRRTIGAELIIFHLMEIFGAIVCGRFLDREGHTTSDANSRNTAVICLGAFLLINCTGTVLAAMQEYSVLQTKTTLAHDIADPSVIPPSLAFACWGFAGTLGFCEAI